MTRRALAIDLGAGSGRVILGTLAGDRLTLTEVHRFANEPVRTGDRLWWDILGLYREVLAGLRAGVAACPVEEPPRSLGIDTWGVDYGLIDGNGRLLQNPVCYRDTRTADLLAELDALGGSGLFSVTGIPNLFFNTSLQLLATERQEPWLAERTARLLFTPDLLNYFLTGLARAERTIASTSQLLEAGARGVWSGTAFAALGLTGWQGKMAELIEPGTVLGPLTEAVAQDAGLPRFEVVAVASHDTESSLLSMPALGSSGAVFLNVGSWALLGVESPTPVLVDAFRDQGFSNEAGFGGKTCLLRNTMGLWLAQEAKREWERTEGPLEWPLLYREAEAAPAFSCWVDPDDPMFVAPGAMTSRVTEFCRRTGQRVPETRGEILRCLIESLAFRLRFTLERLGQLSGLAFERIHLMGGGSRSTLLCSFVANATGLPVLAGPEEASATGNLMAQFLALGALESVEEARELVRRSFETREYRPDSTLWYQAFARARRLCGWK